MKNKLLIILLLVVSNLAFGINVKSISKAEFRALDTERTQIIESNKVPSLFYKSNGESVAIDLLSRNFNELPEIFIHFNDTIISVATSGYLIIDNMNAGEHSMEIYQKDGDEKFQLLNKTFKFKEKEPLIKNDAVVLGMLFLLLALIFKTEASNIPFFKKFYGIVPALLLCYFLPAFLNTFGVISSDESNLYFVASRYLLPASLVLLCLNIDIEGIRRLGPKALIMFFTATIGIVIGGPIALWLVSRISPDILDDEIWRGLATVAGSWIGGGANQTAMKEIYGASDQLFSAMIVVDVFVANVFMSLLLFGTGYNKKINKFFKADDSAIESLKNKMESFQKKMAKVATFKDLMLLIALSFAAIGLAHFLSNIIS
ncbi:MAG: DUF819 family protein, partial [Flavobacteriales bacterium]